MLVKLQWVRGIVVFSSGLLLALFSTEVESAEYVYGTAPACEGKRSDCTSRNLEFVRFEKRNCWSGHKVVCRTKPAVR